MELRRRVHRLHLAGSRRLQRRRWLRDGAADHAPRRRPVGRPRGRGADRRRALGADRHRQPARARGVVRDRVPRPRADPVARVPGVGLVHGRFQRPARPPPVPARRAAPGSARAVLLHPRHRPRRRAARVVGDRPLPLRHRPQGDPRGRGQGAGARRADVRLQAHRLRRVGVLHGDRRRPLRPVVRQPRPDLPVLHPHRRLHGADESPRRSAQPVRPAARRRRRRGRGRVLQVGVRRLAAPPRGDGRAARRHRAVHARGHDPRRGGLGRSPPPRGTSIREQSQAELAAARETAGPAADASAMSERRAVVR